RRADAVRSGRWNGGVVRWRLQLGKLVPGHPANGQPADEGKLVVRRFVPRIVVLARARFDARPCTQVGARSDVRSGNRARAGSTGGRCESRGSAFTGA